MINVGYSWLNIRILLISFVGISGSVRVFGSWNVWVLVCVSMVRFINRIVLRRVISIERFCY